MPTSGALARIITSTSSSVVRTSSIASRPLAASPTTRRSTCSEKNCRKPERTMAWSSTIPILIICYLRRCIAASCVATCRGPWTEPIITEFDLQALLGDLMRWLAFPKMALGLALAALAALALVGINEAGYQQSHRALRDVGDA